MKDGETSRDNYIVSKNDWEQMLKVCAKCGNQIIDDVSLFCNNCGDRLPICQQGVVQPVLTQQIGKRLDENDITIQKNLNNQNSLAQYFEKISIPKEIQDLLWFADGKFRNYDPETREKIIIETSLFSIELDPRPEPSAIFTLLPVNFLSKLSPLENIHFFPKYYDLNPDERYVYLKWLANIKNKVSHGYVFLFYCGLERHLFFGKYIEAVNVIFKLRKYHENSSFLMYSTHALIIAALYHRDEITLNRVLDSIRNLKWYSKDDRFVLLAKYLMKLDLSPDEIIDLSSAVGFKNKYYIQNYYTLFKENLIKELMKEFGKPAYPFSNLEMRIPKAQEKVFSNDSLFPNMYMEIPSVKDSPQFQLAIYSILLTVNTSVKQASTKLKRQSMIESARLNGAVIDNDDHEDN